MKLAMTYAYLKQDLNQIEKALEQTIQANHPVLREASTQLLQAGGKRLRPVFVLLSSMFGEYNLERIKTVAVSLELIHMASLVHDDVIDESELRRGKPTVKAKWDNRVAMYTGDYIFARALEILAEIDNPKAHKILSNTMVELTIGEMEQIKDKFNLDQNLRTYLRRIKRKTALLISSSCQLGAIASNASIEYEKKLYRYGYYIGMSYQIIDDILDFTSTEAQLGKPAGSDLLQGNLTLPALLAIQNDPSFYDELSKLFNKGEDLTPGEIKPVIDKIKSSDVIEKSFELSETYLAKAYESINDLPDIKAKQTFKDIATYIGKRKT
ncbi:heptaprenyl diphosphate synthase component II [Aquibacillus koreensis]|uniref:Heptaprenyl diphosphate synthase component 2 n=1 Tax=Aquibacillus koreensis TaxID=279446 RepID=A0A9X3WHR5_9BACI|nr:heptaprenyl diphosphate synthase component II [Aquibacillus koreensis]MCT2537387.1 heptaprenyl diphosphate synthase component II [Aquibacillus koreensis]MDC3418833.1 heptaprenyl diphosphate synthase component II [Aquibacillus koreensis]